MPGRSFPFVKKVVPEMLRGKAHRVRGRGGVSFLTDKRNDRFARSFLFGVWLQSFCSRSLAKIMRPAEVCSTEVTTTQAVCPMTRLPLSTTIMVPSSR